MKDVIFFACALTCIPVVALASAFSRHIREAMFAVVLFGTTISDQADINFLSCEWYRGTVRGIEVSIFDIIAVGLLLAVLWIRRREGARLYWPFSFTAILLFFVYAILNVAAHDPRLFGLFELTKMLRAIIVFLVAAYFIRSPRDVRILVLAVCATVLFEGGIALRDRYLIGIHRISATLNHPNILSLYGCVTMGILIPQIFSRASLALRMLYGFCALLAACCVILTISRMGVFTLGVVSAAALVKSLGLRLNTRNILVLAMATLLAGAILAKSWATLASRYESATLEEEYLDENTEGRGSYFRQLVPVIREHFFGVGLNNWSYWVSLKYGAEVGTDYDPYDGVDGAPNARQAPPAHNIAVLTIGELGWPGLFLFGLIWAQWFWMGARFLMERGSDVVMRYGAGAFFAMLAIFMQSLTEWEYRNTKIFFLAHIIMGALAAVYFRNQHVQEDGAKNSLVLLRRVLLRAKQQAKPG